MSISPSSPLTGAAVTGLTSPTFTNVADTSPSPNGVQRAVTALGGTQTGSTSHSVSKPFTLSFFRPVQLKTLPSANPTTGVISGIGINSYKAITRKGVLPAANQNPMVARITTTFDIPAGSEDYDSVEILSMLSAHVGYLTDQINNIVTALETGII